MIDAEMYGMMPSANTVSAAQRATGEHVEHVQDGAALLLEQRRQGLRINARDRDDAPDAVNKQAPRNEQQPLRLSSAELP